MAGKYFRKKYWIRVYLKVMKQEGSPESVARGVAIGLVAGLMIPIGFQTAPALFLAFLLRANKVLSWTFTCVTNPASVLAIYPIQCYVGSLVLFHPLSMDTLKTKFTSLVHAETIEAGCRAFADLGWEIILPFFAGGLVFTLLTAPAGYVISYRLVCAYRKRKEQKKANRWKTKGSQTPS